MQPLLYHAALDLIRRWHTMRRTRRDRPDLSVTILWRTHSPDIYATALLLRQAFNPSLATDGSAGQLPAVTTRVETADLAPGSTPVPTVETGDQSPDPPPVTTDVETGDHSPGGAPVTTLAPPEDLAAIAAHYAISTDLSHEVATPKQWPHPADVANVPSPVATNRLGPREGAVTTDVATQQAHQVPIVVTICTATLDDGTQCERKIVLGSHPPRCPRHVRHAPVLCALAGHITYRAVRPPWPPYGTRSIPLSTSLPPPLA